MYTEKGCGVHLLYFYADVFCNILELSGNVAGVLLRKSDFDKITRKECGYGS